MFRWEEGEKATEVERLLRYSVEERKEKRREEEKGEAVCEEEKEKVGEK